MTSEARGELQRAITSNELELHYQPVFDIDGRAVREVEAAMRRRRGWSARSSPRRARAAYPARPMRCLELGRWMRSRV